MFAGQVGALLWALHADSGRIGWVPIDGWAGNVHDYMECYNDFMISY